MISYLCVKNALSTYLDVKSFRVYPALVSVGIIVFFGDKVSKEF